MHTDIEWMSAGQPCPRDAEYAEHGRIRDDMRAGHTDLPLSKGSCTLQHVGRTHHSERTARVKLPCMQ
jgi:hypothetical protein